MMNNEQCNLMAKLASQQVKAGELLDELSKSKAIQVLWPDAFRHGKVKSFWKAEFMVHKYYSSSNSRDDRKAVSFTITNGKGEQRVFPAADVPTILNSHGLLGVGTNLEK